MVAINPETGLGYNNKHGYRHGTPEYNRNNNLLSKYRISLSDFTSLFKKQRYRCAICRSTEFRGKNWHVDHDHKRGHVRGILCCWCNTALGKFQESADIMRRATSYMKRTRYVGPC